MYIPLHEVLVSRHGLPCPYCGVLLDVKSIKSRPTRDHIRSKSRFGRTENDFRQFIVCSECNMLKGDKTLEEFLEDTERRARHIAERLIHLNYLIKMGLE
jgi:5-methylcytosine-specific restriction endonuclease McrA